MSAVRIAILCCVAAGSPWLFAVNPMAKADATASVDFNRDIKPLLSENCFKCHGPDEKERKGKLRLDTRDGALADRKGSAAVVPGSAAKSLLIERLTIDDPELRMPPRKTGKQLKPEQIALLKRWIDQGAQWSDHWAFVPPQRPTPPQPLLGSGRGQDKVCPRNPIDKSILERFRKEGSEPSPDSSKPTPNRSRRRPKLPDAWRARG
jgi:hypothetical protein